jgi:predicted ATPase
MTIYFYATSYKGIIDYPNVRFRRVTWDDLGYRTNFELIFHFNPSKSKRLGYVKIGNEGQKPGQTEIPAYFNELPESYFSLGQSREFYSEVYALPQRMGRQILKAIGDVRTDPARMAKLWSEPVFQLSFKRSLGALQLAIKGSPYSRKSQTRSHSTQQVPVSALFTEDLKIDFSCRLLGAIQPVNCEFIFSRNESIPGRANILVGKNGVGKTQFLANFVGAITGIEKAGYVSDSRAEISKIFAVSYNVFDKFFMPDDIRVPTLKRRKEFLLNSAKYEYIGIRESNNNQKSYRVLGSTSLSRKFTEAVQRIRDNGKFNQWLEAMRPILIEAGLDCSEGDTVAALGRSFRKMGAGHKVSVSILTCLFSRMLQRSLVVMDEPENHLHPSLLSATIHALRRMLDFTDSYAIISTHSPIVTQETPARCIHVLSKSEGFARITPLKAESLGTSLDSLASNIFGIHSEMPDYRVILRDLANRGFSLDELNTLLNRKISIEAASFFVSAGGNP